VISACNLIMIIVIVKMYLIRPTLQIIQTNRIKILKIMIASLLFIMKKSLIVAFRVM